MTYSISLRPRALGEIAAARREYEAVGHGDSLLDELESVTAELPPLDKR